MPELTRRLLDSLQRQATTTRREIATAVAVPDTVMQVEIGLPVPRPASWAEELTPALLPRLRDLLAQLGVDRVPSIAVRQDTPDATAVTMSIDGHPVAYLGRLPSDGGVQPLADALLARTLRRLRILAGPDVSRRSTAAYLTALGCRVPADASKESLDVDLAEKLLDARTGEEIVLEVGASTMRRGARDGAQAVVRLRETEFRKRGVVYPDIRVVLTDDRRGSVRLRLNDVTLPARELGEGAGWADVVTYLGGELARRRHWFVRMRDVARVMDEDLTYVFPDLVAVTEANYPRTQLTACLRELVRSGRRMSNLPRIFWLLLEAGGAPAGSDVVRMSESPLLAKARHRPHAGNDPMVQAVRVRKLATEEAWRAGIYRAPRNTVRLEADIERRLVLADHPDDLARAEWTAVRAFQSAPDAERVITRSVEALEPVREALQTIERPPRVMASHELPPDADIGALPVLGDPRG